MYKEDRYVKTVKEPLTVGVLLLAKELNNIIMPVEFKPLKGSFSIQPLEIQTVLKPRIVNQQWSMKVDIQTRGEVVLNTTEADLTDPAVITKLEQEWSAKLTSLAHDALVMSQKELRTDFSNSPLNSADIIRTNGRSRRRTGKPSILNWTWKSKWMHM